MRHKASFQEKLWKGSRGVISILLAAALLPFFSLAAVLVEAGRYQNSVKALDGAIGSSSISTLAEYESYLHDRFGLLAVKQTDKDTLINDEVAKYLALQKTIDMKGIALDTVTAAGVYPLSDTAVLKQQLLDYSSVLVPAKIALDMADLDNLVSQLEKGLGISAIAKQLSSGAKLISSEVDLLTKLEEAEEQVKTLKTTIANYDAKYGAFSGSVNSLIAHLRTTRPDPEEDEEGAKAWDATASSLRSGAGSAASAYASATQSVINDLQSLHDALGSVITQSTSMLAQVDVFVADSASAMAQVEADVSDKDAAAGYKNIISMNNALSSSAQSVSSVVTDAMATFSESSFVNAIAALQNEKTLTGSFSASSITSASSGLNESSYHYADLSGFTNSDALSQLLTEMEKESDDEAGLSTLFALFDIITSLFNTKLFYDGRLNSTLDLSYYNSNYGGLPSTKSAPADPAFVASDEARAEGYLAEIDPDYDPADPFGYNSTGMAKLERFINTLDNFIDSFSAIKSAKKLKDKLSACADTVEYGVSLCDQMSSLGAIMGQALSNFAQREVMMGYLAFDLPNRTNFNSGATLTGYSYSKAALAYERTGSNVPIVGAVTALTDTYVNYAFVGAELEYIMCGSASEVANQTKVFGFLWGMRILLDLVPVLSNGELQTIFGSLNAIPFIGPVVAVIAEVAAVLIEPLIDTYVLVNGSAVPLLKSKIYIAPSGIPSLIETLSSISLTQSAKNTITSKAQTWAGVEVTAPKSTEADQDKPLIDGGKWVEDIFSFDYTEHLLILMSLFGSEDTYLKRLADLIQCEMTQRNLVNKTTIQQGLTGEYYDFDLDEAYTAIRVEATGSTVQVLPIPSLSTSSMFQFDRVIYRGY